MKLGKQEKRILAWLRDRPVWHNSDRIAEALVPSSYKHTPREWLYIKLRQLCAKKLVRSRGLPGTAAKVFKITQEGIDMCNKRNL